MIFYSKSKSKDSMLSLHRKKEKKCKRESSAYRGSEMGKSEAFFVSRCSLCFFMSDNVCWLLPVKSHWQQKHGAAAYWPWSWASQHCLCISLSCSYQATTSVWGRAPDIMMDLLVGRWKGQWRGRAEEIPDHQTQDNKCSLFFLCSLSIEIITQFANNLHTRVFA